MRKSQKIKETGRRGTTYLNKKENKYTRLIEQRDWGSTLTLAPKCHKCAKGQKTITLWLVNVTKVLPVWNKDFRWIWCDVYGFKKYL